MLKVRNFEKHQHYKDRAPIWIKLYRSLLRDYEFGRLPDTARSHLMLIWLLASETGNEIPNDPVWVGRQINASDPVDLDLLIRTGYLIDCASKSASEVDGDSASKSASAPVSDRASPLPPTVLAQSRAEAEESRERAEAAAEQRQTLSNPLAGQDSAQPAAAAAGGFGEAHSSRFSFAEVETFVLATKPHSTNPGGLARKLWRTGEEDAAIEHWKRPREPAAPERQWPKWVFEGDVEANKRLHLQMCEAQRALEDQILEEDFCEETEGGSS